MSMRKALYVWRDNEAKRRGIDDFRVLPNTTLDEIAKIIPKTKEELCNIKGIKEMKFSQFGNEILKITKGEDVVSESIEQVENILTERESLSVGQYLNIINNSLAKITARIKGEVVTFQVSGNAIYFSIKDISNEGLLSVFMWSSDYRMSNVDIKEGLDVIVEGVSEIYKPNGRFSLRAKTIELVGEGALKKAYDDLKKKLSHEGLFDKERKRVLKDFPTRIGVITSKQGAVIHDFLNNLGKFGYKISFIDSRVEGVLAIRELLSAIELMKKKDIDVLVLIRGGGSLESLQAFNNEHIVRALANFPVPVICAIGHDKDVPLTQLASDYAPSTPSMCTAILNESWNAAKFHVNSYEKEIFNRYSNSLKSKINVVIKAHNYFARAFDNIEHKANNAIKGIEMSVVLLQQAIIRAEKEVSTNRTILVNIFPKMRDSANRMITQISNILEAYDPLKQLQLGYSLVYLKDKILRSTSSVKIGDTINASLVDGSIIAEVIKINKNDKKR